MSAVAQPAGTVTLVFTDIEGSTRLLAELGEAGYRDVLAAHRDAIRGAFGRHGGYEVDNQGDSFFYAFASAADGAVAVREAMAALEGGPIRIRAGMHTGEPSLDPPRYVGLDVHTAVRIMAAAHGGQVVVSQSTRDMLGDSVPLVDLGEHRLKDLSRPQRLFQLGEGGFPRLRTLHRTNLPVPATAFIGRRCELAELDVLLRDGVSLLTLTGPGGVGKTRLALQSVAEAADAFANGVWWVPLASVRDAGLVLSSVALALGVPEQAGRPLAETLADVLSSGRALVLLDNLEHLLPEAAVSLATLRDAGGATVVVTSRERLRLSGEHVHSVGPLQAADAAELYAARTAALDVEAGDASDVEELCSRLDNLPLAVELAAARAGLLPAAEMLTRLGGRLDRLKGGRDADPRQLTLRATIGWSYELLDQAERELFAQLAVFAGGATLDAVEAVCDADLDVLESLLDKSLVRRTDERVWMLETIREFAGELLDAAPIADEVRDRYADHYLALAEDADHELRGPGQLAALERLASERDNLRTAFEELLERDPQRALRLAAALWNSRWMHGHFHEGRETLLAALERAPAEPSAERASALVGAAIFAHDQGDRRQAFALAEEGLACARAAGSVFAETIALNQLSDVAELGRDERIRLIEEAVARARVSGDRWLLGVTIGSYGSLLIRLGDREGAISATEEAYRVCRGVGDVTMSGGWLNNLAWIALQAGNTAEARARLDEAFELLRLVDDVRLAGLVTVNLGWVELIEGDLDRACSRFVTAAQFSARLGERAFGAEVLWGLAQAAAARGDSLCAARLAGCASALGEPAGYDPATTLTDLRHVDDARSTVPEAVWETAWAEGAGLTLDAALALALGR
jgi:predicted ATPase/class 3 adenylate cyclase